jgi:hypothetical protein
MQKWIVLKRNLKFTLKLTLKQLGHVSVQSLSSGSALFELAKVTVVKIINWNTSVYISAYMQPHHQMNHTTSSNNEFPDDGDCTETCRSCFDVNFNVNFKIVFKTIHLCISWWIKKNFDIIIYAFLHKYSWIDSLYNFAWLAVHMFVGACWLL